VEESTHLLGFYAGTRPDDRGRFLREIHRWPDYKLEQTHDYIQWLFPLAERSGFSPEMLPSDKRACPKTSRPTLPKIPVEMAAHKSFFSLAHNSPSSLPTKICF